ncbi:unnamed protein product [Owenia fusiformis]|uniref:DNA-directed RNA polymerase I subunit RPA49 n=1 Tax=Owenia fusiformis TaxID=6347 RepID=A0A8S4NB09_OWEFU|nr:unnamed protein product [Owenia fusiformis]
MPKVILTQTQNCRKRPRNIEEKTDNIKTVEICSQENPVILANFQNGSLEKFDNVTFSLFEKTNSKEEKALVAETDRLSYVGYSRLHEDKNYKYAVAVLDKNSSKVQIHEARITQMQPCIHGDESIDDVTDSGTSFVQKNDSLTSVFGSTKRKRAMQSRLNNKLGEKVLDQSVGKAAQNMITGSPSLVQNLITPVKHEEITASVIPPFDRSATRACDVYLLEDVVPDNVLYSLSSEAHTLADAQPGQIAQWTTEAKYPSFVLRNLKALPVETGARIHRAQCLLYYHYLIILYNLKYSQYRKKDALPAECPIAVKGHLYEMFTLSTEDHNGKKTRTIPLKLKDKIVCYIIVLALHIEQFHLGLAEIMKDVKLSVNKCIQHCRALGCKVNSKKGDKTTQSYYLTLPVPLTFPTMAKQKGKR